MTDTWTWRWDVPLGRASARVEADGTVVWQVEDTNRFASGAFGGQQTAASFLKDGPDFPDGSPPGHVVAAIVAHLRAAGFSPFD